MSGDLTFSSPAPIAAAEAASSRRAASEENGKYLGYTIELIMQEGGNLNTVSIWPDQF